MDCVIYARFSPRPDDKSDSIHTQLDECRSFAKANGWRVVGEHHDERMSGADPDRPGLWDAMDATPKGGVLLVWKMDRLARNLYLAEALHRKARASGFNIQACREGIVDDTPEGTLIRQVLAAAAEYERRLVQVRTSVAMRKYQRDGRRMSRHAPYGYEIDGANLIENPEEQRALGKFVEWREAGYGWRNIANLAEQHGLPRRGKEHQPSTIRKIVLREQQRRQDSQQP